SLDGIALEMRLVGPIGLALSVPIGADPGGAALRRLALRAGLGERGGGHIALDENGMLRLETRLAIGALAPVRDAVGHFLRPSAAWKELVAEGVAEAPAASPEAPGFDWIRV